MAAAMRRSTRGGLPLAMSVWLAVVAIFALLPARPAAAIDQNDDFYDLPSNWSPRTAYTTNGYLDWGNGFTLMRWEDTDGLRTWFEDNEGRSRVLEIGWKETGWTDCRHARIRGRFGFPNDVYNGLDFSEDRSDQVYFVADMDVVARDAAADINKWYGGWWACPGHSHFLEIDEDEPYFQAQVSVCRTARCVPRPQNVFATATYNLLPQENARPSFPPAQRRDQFADTWMSVPWTRSYSVEHGAQGWHESQGPGTALCTGEAVSGRCHLHYVPDVDARGGLYNNAFVKNWQRDNANRNWAISDTGELTNFQVEGEFRCRSSSACLIEVWAKSRDDAWDQEDHLRLYRVPADGRWYYFATDNKPAPDDPSALVDVWVISRQGFFLDAMWVSSGI